MSDVITVISGTDRPGSATRKVAAIYENILKEKSALPLVFSLEGVDFSRNSSQLSVAVEQYIIPARKFMFIMPEYNASFPGVLKLLIDNTDIRRCWNFKKATLTGISDGRAGNIRGVEHMTSILHYLKVNVHYYKILISRLKEESTDDGQLLKPQTIGNITQQIEQFLNY